uniref:Ammonium transporter n=1 Tax=Arion vulgaris TaxID=1028688 RepID=A0A0B7ATC0_9EUPU
MADYESFQNETWHNISAILTNINDITNELNQAFLIIMGIIMLLMQAGFAFIEASCVRCKNAGNALLKNVLDTSVTVIAYWTCGFALAFGKGNSFIGWEMYWASSDIEYEYMAFFFFEFVFAATAATLVSGALSERCDFIAYFIYSFLITAFIYPPITHWAWTDEGWLKKGLMYEINGVQEQIGFHDFSGSGAVHLVGGTAALVGAIILGPRIGRWHPVTGADMMLKGHSVPHAALGAFLLIVGFLAFNGGSQLSMTKKGDNIIIALAITNTIISGSMSAFSALVIRRLVGRNWSVLYTVNGCVSGMVAICGGCDVFRPWGACIVGLVAGVGFNFTSWWVAKLKIDDPVDAVAVHFNGGLWGVIAVAFLSYPNGILMAWDRRSGLMLAWQIVGICAVILWTGTLSAIMFGAMKGLGIFRVSEEVERKGLDLPIHGEHAYPPEAYDDETDLDRILKILESGQFTPSQLGHILREGKDLNNYEHPERKVSNQYAGRKRSRGLSITPSEMEIVVKHKEGIGKVRRQSFAPSEMEIVVKPNTEHPSRVNEAFDEESEKNIEESINNYHKRKGQ